MPGVQPPLTELKTYRHPLHIPKTCLQTREVESEKASITEMGNGTVKPFLRWAGGKTWLIKHLGRFVPKNGYNNYHEPFLGGGSIFFSLRPINNSYLSDLNKELIQTYVALKENVEEVIRELKSYRNTESFYYQIRDKEFDCEIKQAARFIYLNQTSFNGIYRVNLKGKYNVPYGYRTKNFLEAENLRLASLSLRKATLFSDDFESVISNIKKRDLIFIDPPYTVSHNNNGFIKYNQKLFSLEDQYRLSRLIENVKAKGAFYILTNAAHFKILEIFEKGDIRMELSRANLIGGINAQRGRTTEYLFTNIK